MIGERGPVIYFAFSFSLRVITLDNNSLILLGAVVQVGLIFLSDPVGTW